jgi:hypothetical protein
MDVFSTELGIQLSFAKTLEFQGGLNPPNPSPVIQTIHNTFCSTVTTAEVAYYYKYGILHPFITFYQD